MGRERTYLNETSSLNRWSSSGTTATMLAGMSPRAGRGVVVVAGRRDGGEEGPGCGLAVRRRADAIGRRVPSAGLKFAVDRLLRTRRARSLGRCWNCSWLTGCSSRTRPRCLGQKRQATGQTCNHLIRAGSSRRHSPSCGSHDLLVEPCWCTFVWSIRG